MAVIKISVPTYNRWMHIQLFKSLLAARSSDKNEVKLGFNASSFTSNGFNQLWCNALNDRKPLGVTHFLMVHTDISPEEGFADKMVEIMDRIGADLLSVISPLKSGEGFTSTALETEDPWIPKRLTMKEIFKMPATFTHPDLLLNNGCMLVDLRKPWVENILFDQQNVLFHDEKNDKFFCRGFPEDWLFSRRARELGAKIFATREVALDHWGDFAFPNNASWGLEETDYQTDAPLKSFGVQVTPA